jgi:hypothetical protein
LPSDRQEASSAARIAELLAAAELDLHRERTGPDGLYDPDLEAYLNGKCDGLRAALIATGEVEAVKP